MDSTLWLESWLKSYSGTLLIISHDRDFLDNVVSRIVHIEHQKSITYKGNYSAFERVRSERLALQKASYEKQQKRKKDVEAFVDRFRAKASKAKQAQARLKMIERMDMIAAPEEAARRVFTFPEPEELSPPIIRIEGGEVGYNGTAVLKRLDLRIDQDDRIALLGKNGQGKSTLSKLLSDRLPCMAGKLTRSSKLRIGYFAQHQVDELYIEETPLQHLQRERPGTMQSKLRAQLAGFGLPLCRFLRWLAHARGLSRSIVFSPRYFAAR